MHKKKKKYKVIYLTGARSEFGYMKRPLEELNRLPHVEVVVIATGMHTMKGFGNTLADVRKGKFRVIPIRDGNDGTTLSSMVASVGENIRQVSAILAKERPDLVITEGDRAEQLGIAIPARFLNIPILHRAGGNISGSIDNKVRWVLTELADYHFPSNPALGKNLERHGVPRNRIVNIGGVVPDAIALKEYLPEKACRERYGLKARPAIVLVFHPNTEEPDKARKHIDEVLSAVALLKFETIALGSNSDAGGALINARLRSFAKKYPFFSMHTNVPRYDYLGLLNCADVLVGNTSSGFSELPSFKKPYVLIGSRQTSRFGERRHIIEAAPKRQAIVRAIQKALTDTRFRRGLAHLNNPYGNGDFYKKFPREVLKILERNNRRP